MNITEQVKNEILPKQDEDIRDKITYLAALVKSTGSLASSGGKFFLELESKHRLPIVTAVTLIKDTTGAEVEFGYRNEGKTFYLRLQAEDTAKLFGLFNPRSENAYSVFYGLGTGITNRFAAQAYARGVFLACGGAYLPDENGGGYHIEFLFFGGSAAEEFKKMLDMCGLNLSIVEKGNYCGVYAKSENTVSDALAFLGASDSVMLLADTSLKREINNSINRAKNCEMANMDKNQASVVRLLSAAQKLKESGEYEKLDEKLKTACEMRAKYKDDTLEKLAERMGISKSGLSHRFAKIIKTAEEME